MGHDWIIEVLDDIREYTRKNDLEAIEDAVQIAAQTAMHEIRVVSASSSMPEGSRAQYCDQPSVSISNIGRYLGRVVWIK